MDHTWKILRTCSDEFLNMKFYVVKKGGIHVKDAGGESIYDLLEGTKEKGPWYESGQFPDHYEDVGRSKEYKILVGSSYSVLQFQTSLYP